MLEFISAPEAAKKWGISERRVQILLIPKDAEKPADGRLRNKKCSKLQEENIS